LTLSWSRLISRTGGGRDMFPDIELSTVMVDAICGTGGPPGELMKLYEKRGLGCWTGGHVDSWSWYHSGFTGISLSELCLMYHQIKDGEVSWKRK